MTTEPTPNTPATPLSPQDAAIAWLNGLTTSITQRTFLWGIDPQDPNKVVSASLSFLKRPDDYVAVRDALCLTDNPEKPVFFKEADFKTAPFGTTPDATAYVTLSISIERLLEAHKQAQQAEVSPDGAGTGTPGQRLPGGGPVVSKGTIAGPTKGPFVA